jgi:hypothetical protein
MFLSALRRVGKIRAQILRAGRTRKVPSTQRLHVAGLEDRCLLSGGLAGYFTPNDSFQHAIVGTPDGSANEYFFNPQTGHGQDVLGYFNGVNAIAGYYSPLDRYQHVIVAAPDGNLTEIYFDPTRGIADDTLAHFNSTIVGIGAFYTADDQYQHVIVGTSDGKVTEVYFNPTRGIFQAPLTQYGSAIVSVSGSYSSDDNFRHAIVATADGNIHDIYYKPSVGINQRVLVNLGGIVELAGFFTADDNFSHVIVATADGTVRELYYKTTGGVGQATLGTFPGVVHVGGFALPPSNPPCTDGYRNALVETSNGNVTEIYYNPCFGIFQRSLGNFAPQSPAAQDISPNLPDGLIQAYPSTGGRTVAVAGDTSALYAVTVAAGVWKSVNGGPWVQLANAPARAYSIAVDPNNASHLAVGERDGDAADSRVNTSGVWESRDAGATWTYVFNPLSLPGATDQVIPAIAFGPTSTLFIGTPYGIGRKPAGATTFDFSATPPGVGPVTAVAVSQSKTWARTQTKLLVSTNDGVSWTTIAIPTDLNGFHITFNSRGDLFSLGAFDAQAVMPFKPSPDTTSNHNTLLIYNVATGTWLTQVINSGDGTGLGGRRFMKSYVLKRPDLPLTVGQRLQLYSGEGQTIQKAVGVNADGTIQWSLFATAACAGCGNPNDIHSDLWDFHVAADLRTWAVGDGGIYTKSAAATKWTIDNDGMHTHVIPTLTTLPVGHVNRPKVVYPTGDNDHWYRDSTSYVSPPAAWHGVVALGDANWSLGDAGNPAGNRGFAIVARNPALADLTDFGDPPPPGANTFWFNEGQGVDLNPNSAYSGPLFMHFIQTLKEEPPSYPLGDAVMLVNLPLKTVVNGQLVAVPGPLGQPNPGGNPVLIRTTAYAANPSANQSKFQNWSIVARDLPLGTQGFWVAGGHTNPVYYLYAQDPRTGNLVFYKRNADGVGWTALYSGLLPGGWNGPAFVNPFNANQFYLLTPAGIKVSSNGGANIQDDTVLTALLTGSGKFPITSDGGGGNGSYVPDGSVYGGLATLSDMAFNWDNPNEVVTASPFTGVFYNHGDGLWRDLTPTLPRPYTSISAAQIVDGAVYVSEFGRGVLGIVGYRNAALASYFQLDTTDNPSGLIATLRDSRNVALAAASVHLRLTTTAGTAVYDANISTNASGQLFLPGSVAPGTYVVSLQYGGNASTAASDTAFVHVAATHFAIVPASGTITAGVPISITVQALDVNNRVVPGYRGAITFSSTDGQATLPANYTFTAADNGVHTFSGVIFRTAGSRTLTVRNTLNAAVQGSATYTVLPATPHHLVVASSVSTVPAGTPFTVTVTVQDVFNNTVTGYTGTVAFTSGDPYGATLPGNYTFTAGDGGVHAFPGGATLYTAGTWDVTATDTGSGITGRANLLVTPAAADHFLVTTSVDGSSTVAGTAFDVAVRVQDAFNNTVTGYTGTVIFSSGDPSGATLPADYTFQSSDQGSVTFPGGATLYTAGTWDVTATDVNSGITGSDYILVTPAPAASFTITAPTNAAPGVPFDFTVTATDPYGNTDTNYTGTVAFSTMDPAGTFAPAGYTFQTPDMGTASFPMGATLTTAGTWDVTATDVNSGITGSAFVTVASGSPSRRDGTGRAGRFPILSATLLAPPVLPAPILAPAARTAVPLSSARTAEHPANATPDRVDRLFASLPEVDSWLPRSARFSWGVLDLVTQEDLRLLGEERLSEF